jgi:outer membrane biosynthesis protein TonB
MSVAGVASAELRQEQAELSRLAWAFAISILLHLLIFGGFELGKKYHLWETLQWPSWLRPVQQLVQALRPKPVQPVQQPREVPLVFVDVDPALASAEPPKNAQYYSSHNAEAANPDPKKDTDIPEIKGEQTHVVKTEDVPRKQSFPLQPSPPPSPPQEQQEEAKPKPTQPVGDLALAKPEPEPKKEEAKKEEGQAQHKRPRRLADVRPQQDDRLAGEKMKQEGGVKRRLDMNLFNTIATPYGAYDSALIAAVQQRWYALLDEREYALDSRGKVVLNFVLHPDGRVTDMKISENTTTDVLGIVCEKAVLDPAPFPAWPTDMRRLIGEERAIQFTFYYD